MRYDSVLYRVLHVAHDVKCFSSCVYWHLHRQLSDNFVHHKNAKLMDRMGLKKMGRAPGLIENKA